MNYPLQKLESNVDEESLLRGEELFASGKVGDLFEPERNLWLAKVTDGQSHEVEVKISPSKVLAATCECDRYQKEGQCGHIVAALFSLRRHLERKKREKKRRGTPQKSRKLTTGVVLENVSPDELLNFVRQYARTNRNFALALKARFASNVSVIESKDKYLQLLDTALSVARKPDRTISLRGARKIIKVLLEMHVQIEEAIAKAYYAEALTMAQSIIEKISPVLRKVEKLETELRALVVQAFDALRALVAADPAPQLLAGLWEYLLEECRKLLYRNNGIDLHFYRLLAHLADDARRRQQLSGLLSEQAHRYRVEDRNAAPLLILQTRLLEKEGQTEAAQDILLNNLSNPDVLRFGLRQALDRQNYTAARRLALHGLEKELPLAVREEVEEILFRVAREAGDQQSIARYAHRRFLQTLNFQYYDALREVRREEWEALLPELIGEVQQVAFSTTKWRAVAEIYHREQDWPQLAGYLRQCRSLDLLQEFTAPLLRQEPETVYHLYQDLIHHYLHNHLGRRTSRRIRDAMTHLLENGAPELAGRLVEAIRAEYGERHSLMEELETLKAV